MACVSMSGKAAATTLAAARLVNPGVPVATARIGTARRPQVVRAVAEQEAPEAPAAPTKGMYSKDPTFTGMKTDTAGITVIDVIEPAVYSSGSAGSSSSAGAAIATVAALAAAGGVLAFMSTEPASGPTLSQLAERFEAELATLEAPAPAVAVVEVVEAAPAVEVTVVEAIEAQ